MYAKNHTRKSAWAWAATFAVGAALAAAAPASAEEDGDKKPSLQALTQLPCNFAGADSVHAETIAACTRLVEPSATEVDANLTPRHFESAKYLLQRSNERVVYELNVRLHDSDIASPGLSLLPDNDS